MNCTIVNKLNLVKIYCVFSVFLMISFSFGDITSNRSLTLDMGKMHF